MGAVPAAVVAAVYGTHLHVAGRRGYAWPVGRCGVVQPAFATGSGVTLAREKARVRAEMREARRRAAVAPDKAALAVRDRFVAQFGDRLAGAGVSAYWPIGDELDSRPLLCALAERGATCALPAVVGRGRELAFRRWRPGDTLVEAGFGLSEPAETAATVTPDIVVAPLLAVDSAGRRLGYGGGYYDRTIAALKLRGAVVVVGIGYDAQIRTRVPAGAGDRRVDWVVSEERTLECRETA